MELRSLPVRSERQARLVQIGTLPPPTGGVATIVDRLNQYALSAGLDAEVVRPRPKPLLALALRLVRRPVDVLILHLSDARRLNVGLALAWLMRTRRQKILYVHASQFAVDDRKPAIGGSSVLYWVTNTDLAMALERTAPARVKVISPPIPVAEPRAEIGSRIGAELRLLASTYGDGSAYNIDLCIGVLDELNRREVSTRLQILRYGGSQLEIDHPHAEVLHETDREGMEKLLRACDVYLRLTNWDGDSLLVREALAAGCRVIASDVVPRPAGTELVSLRDSASIADVIVAGGPVSTGDGLSGVSATTALRELFGADPDAPAPGHHQQ